MRTVKKTETDNMAISVETIDYGYFEKLLKVLSSPYVVPEEHSEYLLRPKPDESVLETFCGTFEFYPETEFGATGGLWSNCEMEFSTNMGYRLQLKRPFYCVQAALLAEFVKL
jgi:hypothetical protein